LCEQAAAANASLDRVNSDLNVNDPGVGGTHRSDASECRRCAGKPGGLAPCSRAAMRRSSDAFAVASRRMSSATAICSNGNKERAIASTVETTIEDVLAASFIALAHALDAPRSSHR
jgi:hypothetical protein